jgi:RND family efflux transporter MFP subunit
MPLLVVEQDVVPLVQRDQAHLQLTQAESQLAMAEATLKEVETAGSYAAIRSPFAGEVVARYIDQGDVAAPGMPLLVVEQAGPREGRLAVPVDAAFALEVGSTISVTTVGGRVVDAPVRVLAAGADPMSKTVEVRVTLPADWPTGVSVTALVPTGATQAITIPTEAVVRRGQLTGVQVVTPAGPALRWIRLGRAVGEDRVEVLSGLNQGDEIILNDTEAAQ